MDAAEPSLSQEDLRKRSDDELIQQYCDAALTKTLREEIAEELDKRFRPKVIKYVHAFGKAFTVRIDTEEIVNTVMAKFFLGALSSFRGESSVETWLHMIVENDVLTSKRKEEGRARGGPRRFESIDEPYPGQPVGSPGPYETISAEDPTDAFHASILVQEILERSGAKPLSNLVVILRKVEELSREEVAKMLDKTEDAISQIQRRNLRKHVTYMQDSEIAPEHLR